MRWKRGRQIVRKRKALGGKEGEQGGDREKEECKSEGMGGKK